MMSLFYVKEIVDRREGAKASKIVHCCPEWRIVQILS